MTERDDEAKATDDSPAEESPPKGAGGPDGPEERPQETFKKGVGLLWQAAQAAAGEIKREVDKGGVSESIQQAGRDLEDAANMAAKAIEGFIERASGTPPSTNPWEPDEPAASPEGEAKGDDDSDDDDPKGDVRIQVDD